MKLTEEQQKVYDDIMEQVFSLKGRNRIISAAAGTGKTTLICELVCDLLERDKKIYVGAMTGKATAVIRGKIEQALEERGIAMPPEEVLMMETVATLTKKARVVGMGGDGTTLFQNVWRDPKEFKYDILFIDELSMVPQWTVDGGFRLRQEYLDSATIVNYKKLAEKNRKKILKALKANLKKIARKNG